MLAATDQTTATKIQGKNSEADTTSDGEEKVVYKFCDLQSPMCKAWEEEFRDYIPDRIKVYKGDIFRDGPAADAIVSPANSFGFMDGGIDMAYSRHFGWQMQERLQKLIREKHHGELLVGEAVIIPSFEGWVKEGSVDWSRYNEGKPIKWLVSAPTMRVPMDVSDTANAYLAFRAVILAVQRHNSTPGNEPIRSVLCPGLGTAVGRMPAKRCAYQMLTAYETYELDLHSHRINPSDLGMVWGEHERFKEYGAKGSSLKTSKADEVTTTLKKTSLDQADQEKSTEEEAKADDPSHTNQ